MVSEDRSANLPAPNSIIYRHGQQLHSSVRTFASPEAGNNKKMCCRWRTRCMHAWYGCICMHPYYAHSGAAWHDALIVTGDYYSIPHVVYKYLLLLKTCKSALSPTRAFSCHDLQSVVP